MYSYLTERNKVNQEERYRTGEYKKDSYPQDDSSAILMVLRLDGTGGDGKCKV
jgi:hypothetical protein